MKAVIVILLLFCKKDHFANGLNIALNQRVFPNCKMEPIAKSFITDGSTDPSKFLLMENNCPDPEDLQIIVSLRKLSLIGHVVVYAGMCEDCDAFLDNFIIKLLPKDNSGETLCGQYSGTFLRPEYPMRINCDLKHQVNKYIERIVIRPNIYAIQNFRKAAIAEIEVHSLENRKSNGYYGCYRTFIGKAIESKTETSCRDICRKRGYRFMKLMENRTIPYCECGNDLPSGVLSDITCSVIICRHEADTLCSNGLAHPIYLVSTPHIYSKGCFPSKISADAINDDSMTASMCIKHCSDGKALHAYLQNSSYCYCKDEINEEAEDGHLCNSLCGGGDMTCGGKDHALVYSGCMNNKHQTQCWKIFHCKGDEFDEFGKCFEGCKDGFLGESCIERELLLPTTATTRRTQQNKPSINVTVPEEDLISNTTAAENDINSHEHDSDQSNPFTHTESQNEENESDHTASATRKIPIVSRTCLAAYEEIRAKHIEKLKLESLYLPPSFEKLELADYEEDSSIDVSFQNLLFMILTALILSMAVGIAFGVMYSKC